MPELNNRSAPDSSLPQGALVHRADRRADVPVVTIIDYSEASFQEKQVTSVEECFPFRDTKSVSWINIDGMQDVGFIERLGQHFGFHPLVVEDILDLSQRPKCEDMESYILIATKMFMIDDEESGIKSEQVSLVLGENFVVSFQESRGDVFNAIRERIRTGKGRVRKMGADYLAYSLVDAVVDNYFVVMEQLGDAVEEMETEVLTNPSVGTLTAIHGLKRDMTYLRKSVWPLREVLSALMRSESDLIQETTNVFLRDVYDHTIQVIDTLEILRDVLSDLVDVYLSSITNRTNEIMKVLTVFMSVCMPMTVVTGIYGMNFQFLPEIHWRWGYYFALGLLAAISITLSVYFKRKKWF